MSEVIKTAYSRLVTLSADETRRQKVITREIEIKDQEQRIKDAMTNAALDGRKEEAIEILRELLMEYHQIDIKDYLDRIRLQPLEKVRELRQSLRKEKSLVIQDLESL